MGLGPIHRRGVAIQYIGYRSLFLLTATISFAALPLVSTIKDLKVRSRIKLTNISRDFSKFLVPSLFLFMVMGMMGFALAMYYNEVRGDSHLGGGGDGVWLEWFTGGPVAGEGGEVYIQEKRH